MWRNSFWEWWEQFSSYVVGPLLIVLSLLVNKYLRPYWASHYVDDLIVALLIAGALTITVDPFVKRKARREATRDIFHHMLGFSLPIVIRERLQDTVEKTKLYRRNTTLHMVMSENADSVVFDIEMEFEVVNPTPHDLGFSPLLQFERSEQPILKSIDLF
jgi:hypothetical protein